MGVPSLGYLCRRTAIANISQVTYVPEDLPIDTIMDILRCVPTAGLLKVIQANSPHVLQHDQIETLWERFSRKEFSYLLRAKIEAHKKEFGQDSYFPTVPWEEVYDMLAHEEFLRLREDTALLASRTMQLNKEKTMKQTTLLADPRMLLKARVRGAPGARSSPARGPRNAVQKAAEESRQLAVQRKQAIAVASKPPTKINVAPKGLQDALRISARVIKAPAKKLGQKRIPEVHGDEGHDMTQTRSLTPASASTNGHNKSGDLIKSAVSNASTTATTVKPTLPITIKKPAPAPAPSRTGGIFGSSKPLSMRGLPPIETKEITNNSNGTVTISVSIDWTSPRNKQILESYSATEKTAALSKPATKTTIPAAEYRKRGCSTISSDDSAGPSASASTSNSMALPSADEATTRQVAPSKKRKVAPSLFMPHKVVARPRTQD
ncbi:hypothetical protein N0V93_001096 [Gnomoniopsis smithogilvyi]|uniref:Uncharacterized protein n=1 Tax=Gnomoniopsis smithogilvyi TaxID=1191159 RepID=A0A9W9D1X8_9PEZI|nr:hypothetical protein N0V93_001096 [Gnomoniopsis smithogilvyi]